MLLLFNNIVSNIIADRICVLNRSYNTVVAKSRLVLSSILTCPVDCTRNLISPVFFDRVERNRVCLYLYIMCVRDAGHGYLKGVDQRWRKPYATMVHKGKSPRTFLFGRAVFILDVIK
jgi:hypothetical protein